jgi:hypothetical protein
MDVLSNVLTVRFDPASKSLMILRSDDAAPLVQVSEETYSQMSFEEAAEFVGARLLLLMPGMRDQFDNEIKKMASSETGKGLNKT